MDGLREFLLEHFEFRGGRLFELHAGRAHSGYFEVIGMRGKTPLGLELMSIADITMRVMSERILIRVRDSMRKHLLGDVSTYDLHKTIHQIVGETYDYDFIENFIVEHFEISDSQWNGLRHETKMKPKDEIGQLCLLHNKECLIDGPLGIAIVLKRYYNTYVDIDFLGSTISHLHEKNMSIHE
jgi:hypothetical protein